MAKYQVICLVTNLNRNPHAKSLTYRLGTTLAQAKKKASKIQPKLPGDTVKLTLYKDDRVVLKRILKYL